MNKFLEKALNDKQNELEQILTSSKTKQDAEKKLLEYFKIDGATEEENKRTLEIQGIPKMISSIVENYFK